MADVGDICMHIEGASLVETQDFASHEGGVHLLPAYYSMCMSVWVGRETQNFASLQGRNAFDASVLSRAYVGMGQDGRRKILRLYFGLTEYNRICLLLMIMVAAACRDAKSCVSRWRSEYVASVL